MRAQPRFKSGIQFYEFEQKAFQFPARDDRGLYPNKQSKIEYSDWVPFVSGGTTLFIDRFFLDFDLQYLFNGQATSDFSSQTFVKGGRGLATDIVFQNNSQLNADFNRFEWAVSAGFEVINNLVLYGGYKYAETNHTSNVFGRMTSFQANNNIPIPSFSGSTIGEVDINFEYDGPFVGLNYNWGVKQSFLDGAFSFNFAVAFLDSQTKLDISGISIKSESGLIIPLNFQDGERNDYQYKALNGESTGYSIGIGWQGFTSIKNLTYVLGVTGYRYEFDGSETIENRVRLDLGLAYSFNF